MNVRIPKDKVAFAQHMARMKLLKEQEVKHREAIKRKSSENKKDLKIAAYCRVANYDQL